jgi:hypothetical protein
MEVTGSGDEPSSLPADSPDVPNGRTAGSQLVVFHEVTLGGREQTFQSFLPFCALLPRPLTRTPPGGILGER